MLFKGRRIIPAAFFMHHQTLRAMKLYHAEVISRGMCRDGLELQVRRGS
jgi:hypothetical protein